MYVLIFVKPEDYQRNDQENTQLLPFSSSTKIQIVSYAIQLKQGQVLNLLKSAYDCAHILSNTALDYTVL